MNDCISQVKGLDPVLEEKKAPKRFFMHSTYLYSLNIIFTKELLQILESNEVNIEHVRHFNQSPSENFCHP